jgi:RNA polymerase sigma-70 factor (ECF subfamily)
MTDEYAMKSVAEGDLAKAGLLYERYKRPLYNFFLRFGVCRDSAQDLTQQVFVRLLQYRHTYKDDGAFKTWIYRIARNVHNDFYKNNPLIVSDLEMIERSVADEVSTDHDAQHLVQKAMQFLSDDYREVLILSKYEALKYEEIARILDCSVALVKVRVHRAIKQLREIYFQLEAQ